MMLSEEYKNKVVPKLAQEIGVGSGMAVPRVEKVVINSGIGDIVSSREEIDRALEDLGLITGQKPSLRQAKAAVSSFGIRRGQPVGIKITLRGKRMYDFLQKLFNVVLPRLRDFRGVSGKSFDKQGNYTLGIAEHTVFPEVDFGKTNKPRGLEITIVTSADDKRLSKRLLEELGMPFEKKGRARKHG